MVPYFLEWTLQLQSGPERCSIYSRVATITVYVYVCIIVRLLFSASVASQVDKAFYFDSIIHGHHNYIQDIVDSAEGWKDHWPCPVQATVERYNLQLKHGRCRMFSSFLLWHVTVPLCNSECYSMRHLFEGRYYFASLFAKCGVNLRVATKWTQKELVSTEDLHSIFLCRSPFLDPLQAIVVCISTCQEHGFGLEFNRNQTCMHPIKILYCIIYICLLGFCMLSTWPNDLNGIVIEWRI